MAAMWMRGAPRSAGLRWVVSGLIAIAALVPTACDDERDDVPSAETTSVVSTLHLESIDGMDRSRPVIDATVSFDAGVVTIEIVVVNDVRVGNSVTCGSGSSAVRSELEADVSRLPHAVVVVDWPDSAIQCRLPLEDGTHLGFLAQVFPPPNVCGVSADGEPTPTEVAGSVLCGSNFPDVVSTVEGDFTLVATVSTTA
ncbi:MAG: hypothetical protein ABMA25_09530 [Ilumatobacteraceae bacterium]